MSNLAVTPQAIADAIQELLDENETLKRELEHIPAVLRGRGQPTGPNRLNAKKLTGNDVHEIRLLHASGMKQRDIAYSYDVNPATVSRIVRGIYHKVA